MPSVLTEAPQFFQKIFKKHCLFNSYLFVYLDDIIIGHNDKRCLHVLPSNCITILKKVNLESKMYDDIERHLNIMTSGGCLHPVYVCHYSFVSYTLILYNIIRGI